MLQKIMTLRVFFITPNKNWGQKTAGKKVFSCSFLIAELRQIESGDAKRKSWSIFGYFSPIHGERKTRLQLGNNFFGYAYLGSFSEDDDDDAAASNSYDNNSDMNAISFE